MNQVITDTVDFLLLTPAAPYVCPTRLTYRTFDPLCVTARFPQQFPHVSAPTWTLGRDLLAEGLHTPVGQGDVRVRPLGRDRTLVELHSHHGAAALTARTAELARFLDTAYALVPRGHEGPFIDWTALTDLQVPDPTDM